ncbi:hypothetical protein [Solirubrum puertoriconensis]|uniref:Uncharacterized protein n=1 Tax=Solirubrum puertoriconensis TaxID=1751427 RepID=A0A9X0HMG1_SOLP1|nr:hypothetical protein [Solirubrum puertoriconensis]KUG08713.1 hypothetical protein ASU33_11265 [Solirubrum puertoriconensis]
MIVSATNSINRLHQLQAELQTTPELTLNELQPVLREMSSLLQQLPGARAQVGLAVLYDLQAEYAAAYSRTPGEQGRRWLNRGMQAVLTQVLKK